MRVLLCAAGVVSALSVMRPVTAGAAVAQPACVPAGQSSTNGHSRGGSGVLQRRITLRADAISLRDALDRVAAAARIRISYSAELLPLERVVCLRYESAPVARVLSELAGPSLEPVVVAADQVALTPVTSTAGASPGEAGTVMKQVGQLDRVVVTGTNGESSRRADPAALDVVSGEQIARRGSRTLSGSLDGIVPGLWLWEQSPLNMLTRYGSVRGASSFGVSYPKVYVDGIEVANSLLVTHLDPDAVSRIEVIRGPQGAALYGADAISGVMNIVTRHEGAVAGTSGMQVRTQGGASASDYSPSQVFAQSHAATLRVGNDARSARLGVTAARIGAFIPDAFSQQLSASGSVRLVKSRSVVAGTFRLFAQDALTPLGVATPSYDHPGSLSRLTMTDSTDRRAIRQYTIGGTASFTPGARWTHTAVAGIDGYTLSSELSDGGILPTAIDSALADATGSAVRASVRASSVARFGNPDRTSATVTMSAEHSVLRDVAAIGQPAGATTAPSMVESRSNTGLIGQVSAGFQDVLFLNAGLRVERNSALDNIGEFAMLPMLGATAIRSVGGATIKLRTAFGKGIRPVQAGSRTRAIPGFRGSLPGLRLSPEEQSGIEFGADASFGDNFGFHVTRFDQRASGLVQPVGVVAQVTTPAGQTITYSAYELQNVGEIANTGWELKGSLSEGPWFAAATFSQISSKVSALGDHYTGDLRKGDRMLEVPARTFGISAAFTQPRWFASWTLARASDWINYDRLALMAASHAAAGSAPPHGAELRSFWRTYDGVTRASARIELEINRGMTLTLDGENLLDEQRGEPDNVTVLPGRTVSAGLRMRF